jgi:hypothetical protein
MPVSPRSEKQKHHNRMQVQFHPILSVQVIPPIRPVKAPLILNTYKYSGEIPSSNRARLPINKSEQPGTTGGN